ncbi:MAG: helix-turn-helix domain-containing protein [Hyphomicrobiales bacterium]
MTDQSVIKKRQRRPEDRPAEILAAALALFSEKGFAATRMDDVARRAGLSKGALYLYFPDKASLLAALVQETAGSTVAAAALMVEVYQGPVAPLIPQLLHFLADRLDHSNIALVIKLVLAESRAHPPLAGGSTASSVGPSRSSSRWWRGVLLRASFAPLIPP